MGDCQESKIDAPLVLVIRNLCVQGEAPKDVLAWLNEIHGLLEEYYSNVNWKFVPPTNQAVRGDALCAFK